jgi:phage terminase large subunit-like protein
MTRGERVIAFVEGYCRVPEGALVGRPLKLEQFQKNFILAVYDNSSTTSEAYLSIARKNGKTALIARLVLAHLVGPEAQQNSQIVSGAMSREQASIVFSLVAKMVRLNSELVDIIRIVDSRKELYGLPMGSQYRALAAEGKTAHGLSPSLAILDEVGQVRGPKSEFVDAITTSQGAHEWALMLAISTQAADPADSFSVWLDDAAASGDPRIVSHVYSAPNDAELDDPEAWKAANPALGTFRSLLDVRQQAAEGKRMPIG